MDKKRLQFQVLVYLILIISLCLICYMVIAQSNRNRKHFTANDWEYIEYQVQDGDTYYGIAEQNCPNNIGVSEYVYNLIYVNGDKIVENDYIIIFKLKEKGTPADVSNK